MKGSGQIPYSENGFTLIEVIISFAILVVGMIGIAQVIVASQKVTERNRELALAMEAIKQQLENMKDFPLQQIFQEFNGDPNDDINGPATAPGANFSVAGLTALPTDLDGQVGRIVFPSVNVGGVEELRENVTILELGMPRDLNNQDENGIPGNVIETGPVNANYMILPAQLVIQWDGPEGEQIIRIETIFSR